MELIHKDLSESIISAAMALLKGLRPEMNEKLYERALVIERGHRAEPQRQYPVFYDDQHIGSLVPDLIVDDA